ncbi:leucine--tRNA ligase [Candidatus Parcubacteria bacterium]|nr:MAG: leucine--tRNA ligase [Candidatus Parcubacteria bacterium]
MEYNHKKIEEKWKKKWEKTGIYKVDDKNDKPKYYILDMFPYPSGEGLHVGHPKGYIATDIFARMKMMQGFNVLHPMGWDAFGLPAENYAIKNKVHPKLATDKNVATYKRQLEMLGFSYDWEREINTTDPEFYKWTQWIFLKMFERGLAYESNEPINWCPSCKTGLANEDLEDGRCERCGSEIERVPMRQWVLKITDYADRLLNDIDKLEDWEESIKEQQRNWIGRSEGARVNFQHRDGTENIEVFTTRPDTLFGATYMVLAPEHKLVSTLTTKEQKKTVQEYIKNAAKKSNLERTELQKEKTGVFTGAYAINPVSGKEIPIWIADYVLAGYGTGAIMSVPAHDERDWEFAKKYGLDIVEVVLGGEDVDQEAFCGEGTNVNSGFLNTLETADAKEKMFKWLEEKKRGEKAVNYKLEDWVFSRQRYWGEPIPLVHCAKCGVVPVPEKELPVVLPDVENYEPTGTGESPLAAIEEWVNTKCPKCLGEAKRETNTMPQWAGSSWYYLRYIDPKNDKELVSKEKESYWSPVDFYVGGAEHATRHLIYARFWHKFLFDIGAVAYDEPFKRLQHVGLIQGEDNRKMSKRWGNVINPDEIVDAHGADSMRVYEMFMGPFSQAASWSTNGLVGARKFIEKSISITEKVTEEESSEEIKNLLHKTIKKVAEDIEDFKFNTAISQMMILVNKITEIGSVNKKDYLLFISVLAPFAPHICEEIREKLGETVSVFESDWPKYDPELIIDKKINLVIQVNGKLRETIEVEADIQEEEAKKIATENETIQKWIEGKEIVKTIFVKGKLVNIVVK